MNYAIVGDVTDIMQPADTYKQSCYINFVLRFGMGMGGVLTLQFTLLLLNLARPGCLLKTQWSNYPLILQGPDHVFCSDQVASRHNYHTQKK